MTDESDPNQPEESEPAYISVPTTIRVVIALALTLLAVGCVILGIGIFTHIHSAVGKTSGGLTVLGGVALFAVAVIFATKSDGDQLHTPETEKGTIVTESIAQNDQVQLLRVGITALQALDPRRSDISQKWEDTNVFLTDLIALLDRLIAALRNPGSDHDAALNIATAIAETISRVNSTLDPGTTIGQIQALQWVHTSVSLIVRAGRTGDTDPQSHPAVTQAVDILVAADDRLRTNNLSARRTPTGTPFETPGRRAEGLEPCLGQIIPKLPYPAWRSPLLATSRRPAS